MGRYCVLCRSGVTWWGPSIVHSRHGAERERLLQVWNEGSESLAPRSCRDVAESPKNPFLLFLHLSMLFLITYCRGRWPLNLCPDAEPPFISWGSLSKLFHGSTCDPGRVIPPRQGAHYVRTAKCGAGAWLGSVGTRRYVGLVPARIQLTVEWEAGNPS